MHVSKAYVLHLHVLMCVHMHVGLEGSLSSSQLLFLRHHLPCF